MYEAIDGTSFQTNWRCKLHNSILTSNGKNTIRRNIRLLKDTPEKVGATKETAQPLIDLLESVSNDQAWSVAKAMAGLSIEKAIQTLNSMSE